jgi:NADH-quinone oxidoreductase subunit E
MERVQLLGMIKGEQEKRKCVSEEAMVEMARGLGMTLGDVYGVTTFYAFLSTKPLGRHVIRVCKSVPCCLKEAEVILRRIQEELDIGPGETTADGRFTLEVTNCIGACDEAPAMLVDEQVHGNLTPEKISETLRSFD